MTAIGWEKRIQEFNFCFVRYLTILRRYNKFFNSEAICREIEKNVKIII